MEIIKLNATDSTNDFLKELSKSMTLKHLTAVISKTQSQGKGQQGTKWFSSDKNLMTTLYLDCKNLNNNQLIEFNFMVSVSIFEVIRKVIPNQLYIKWPNDILADEKKICGILIENNFEGTIWKESFVGIGLNINETTFPKELQNKATSFKLETNENWELEEVLGMLIFHISKNFEHLKNGVFFKEKYVSQLYRFQKHSKFIDLKENKVFEGEICDVSADGKLMIDTLTAVKSFNIKEIKFHE